MGERDKFDPTLGLSLLDFQRLQVIEILAFWEGQVDRTSLEILFDIRRDKANQLLNTYKRKFKSIVYDKSAKTYLPESFTPQITQGDMGEYLNLVTSHQSMDGLTCLRFYHSVHQVNQVKPDISPILFRNLCKAIRRKKRIDVDYRSISAPSKDGRIIAPHSMVFSGSRWFVRAWCEKNKAFRDFVLSRFYDQGEFEEGKATHSEIDDVKWNTRVDVMLQPDPRLNKAQQAVVSKDYGMVDGELVINTRKSLVPYLLKQYGIDFNNNHPEPAAQQIIVKNRTQVKEWLI